MPVPLRQVEPLAISSDTSLARPLIADATAATKVPLACAHLIAAVTRRRPRLAASRAR
jgi:hypothetical protein